MVADTIRRSSSVQGLQPLRLARDWRQVIDLIELAFGENLDIEARRALHSMRLPPLLAPLIGLLDSVAGPGEGMMPGFVWLEAGQVVGTASVRRVHSLNQGWLISNVAVHPDWQGRGIGRALLEASLDYAQDYGGTWVVLQVRKNNLVARQLYESLGFKSVSEVIRLRKSDTLYENGPDRAEGLRPARWSEGSVVFGIARTLTPHYVLWADNLNRDYYKTGPLSRLGAHLKGRRRQWWVHDLSAGESTFSNSRTPRTVSTLMAAVGIEIDPRNSWHRLRLLIPPEAQDKQLAARLIAFGLAQLISARPLPVEVEYPASDAAVHSALAEAGFKPIYALVHMRLNFK